MKNDDFRTSLEAKIAARVVPIPKGTILPWFSNAGPMPDGWVRCGVQGTPELAGLYLRGSSDFNDAGRKEGTESHSHEFTGRTSWEVEGTKSGPEGADNYTGGPNWNHKHDFSGRTAAGSSLPPSLRVMFLCKT